jgi:hypothetical protein
MTLICIQVKPAIFVLLISQVFPYGSVPLKTYLPDGDIDLTVFAGSAPLEDVFVTHVHTVLKGEENNEAAQYHVKDVHRIDAEVFLTLIP